MRRREFIALMGRVLHGRSLRARKNRGGPIAWVACLRIRAAMTPYVAFFDGLRRRGFIEGHNLTVEYRAFGTHFDLLLQYAAELVNARVDVIVAASNDGVCAVQQATKTIPIVALVGDMLGSGYVNSLSRPDGNTTGVSILAEEADGKRQDILIEAVPALRLMAVLTDVKYTNAAKLDALQKAARAHSIEFSIHRVAKGEEIAAALDSAQASGATALNILVSPLFYAYRHLIMERAAAGRLPTIYEFPEVAEEGGFAAYGPRRGQFYAEIMPRQIVQLFRGTNIADIPVEQATKFELAINLKTANAMGVTVPPALLARADEVIE
jgi:putative ABC transport system substrate-binding protein